MEGDEQKIKEEKRVNKKMRLRKKAIMPCI
jgi:hypothetical protein